LLDILAFAVERDPCEEKNWTRLVNMLGPIDATSNSDKCQHTLTSVQSGDGSWWGKRRVLEWEEQFFHPPKSSTKAVKPEFVRLVAAAVDSALSQTSEGRTVKRVAGTTSKAGDTSMPNPKECLGWIWNPQQDAIIDDYDQDVIEDMLPTNSSEGDLNFQHMTTISEILESLSSNPMCEALCMKIIVACHLMGAWHPFVCNSIWWLAVKLWQTTQAADQSWADGRNQFSDSLVWLSMHGLNILAYLQCRLKQSKTTA